MHTQRRGHLHTAVRYAHGQAQVLHLPAGDVDDKPVHFQGLAAYQGIEPEFAVTAILG